MVGITMSTGTGRKPDIPRSQVQMAQLDGEIIKHFWADFPERKNRFFSRELELKNFAVDWISAEKMAFFVTGPGPCQIKMTSVDFVLSREEQWLCILGDLGAVSQLKNFHPAFSPDPTDCPWVSEDINGGYAIKAKKPKQKKNSSSWADTKHRKIHHR